MGYAFIESYYCANENEADGLIHLVEVDDDQSEQDWMKVADESMCGIALDNSLFVESDNYLGSREFDAFNKYREKNNDIQYQGKLCERCKRKLSHKIPTNI